MVRRHPRLGRDVRKQPTLIHKCAPHASPRRFVIEKLNHDTLAMARVFQQTARTDVRDSAAVGHLRNYSNYLLPRGRSGVRNLAEAVAVISRGLLANACLVLVVTLFCALLTQWAFPRRGDLLHGSFIPSLLGINDLIGSRNPFPLTLWLIGIIAVVLLTWALLRSLPWGRRHDDVSSPMLVAARVLLITIVIVAFLDLQPVLIELLARLHAAGAYATTTAF